MEWKLYRKVDSYGAAEPHSFFFKSETGKKTKLFYEARKFKDGFACVQEVKNGPLLFLDDKGRLFYQVKKFGNGFSAVKEDDSDLWHFRDREGNVSQDSFVEIRAEFYGDSYDSGSVLVKNADGLWYFRGENGERLSQSYDDIEQVYNSSGYAVVKIGGQSYIIDKSGKKMNNGRKNYGEILSAFDETGFAIVTDVEDKKDVRIYYFKRQAEINENVHCHYLNKQGKISPAFSGVVRRFGKNGLSLVVDKKKYSDGIEEYYHFIDTEFNSSVLFSDYKFDKKSDPKNRSVILKFKFYGEDNDKYDYWGDYNYPEDWYNYSRVMKHTENDPDYNFRNEVSGTAVLHLVRDEKTQKYDLSKSKLGPCYEDGCEYTEHDGWKLTRLAQNPVSYEGNPDLNLEVKNPEILSYFNDDDLDEGEAVYYNKSGYRTLEIPRRNVEGPYFYVDSNGELDISKNQYTTHILDEQGEQSDLKITGFVGAYDYHDGLAIVVDYENLYRFRDIDGVVSDDQYEEATDYENGFAKVKSWRNSYEFYDKKKEGKQPTQPWQYRDMLGRVTNKQTKSGLDFYRFVKGEISVQDLNQAYFNDKIFAAGVAKELERRDAPKVKGKADSTDL